MKLIEKLRKYADGELQLGYGAELALLHEAADLLDATIPRPWPPPVGTKKCLIWRKGMGWFVDEPWSWLSLDKDIRPQFWLPIPPDPEESK